MIGNDSITVSVLAAMVSPALFYAGAAAVAVPILIHLLSKQRFRRIRWAATDFLLEAQRKNRRRVRIEELILLALRCLAMVLAGLLLARWFVRPEGFATILGSAARTDRIVLLDDSASMWLAHQPAPANSEEKSRATVFDRGKSAMLHLVERLRAESPGDSVTILLSSRPDRAFRAEASAGEMDLAAFQEEVEGLQPSYRSGNLRAALASIRQRLDEGESSVDAAVYVISDFQQIDWSPGREMASARSPHSAQSPNAAGQEHSDTSPSKGNPLAVLSGWAGENRALHVVLIDVGQPDAENLCVTAIEAESPQAVAGVGSRYVARISHFGRTESKPTALHVYVGDAAQPAIPVPSLAPGQTADVPIEVTFANEGYEALTVELGLDALPVDNSRSIGIRVERALRLLVVNGERSADPYDDEVFLLTVALRPEGPQFSGNEITIIGEDELEPADLSSFHVVILANVHRMTQASAERLETYTAAGGGVLLFLGDQVDADRYNRELHRNGKGLLPIELGEVVTRSADRASGSGGPGVRFGMPDETHPVMRRFADTQVAYFSEAAAWQYFACPLDNADKISPTSDETTGTANDNTNGTNAIGDRGPLKILLRFDDSEGHPAIVERAFGRGRVVLVTTSADKEWNNQANRPVYVLLTMELVQYLARRRSGSGEQLVGEPIVFALDAVRHQPTATLKRPTFPIVPAITLNAQPDSETGKPSIRWDDTQHPGLYRFDLSTTASEQVVRQVAVNIDPRESDLRPSKRADLTEPVADLSVEYVSDAAVAAHGEHDGRRELWPLLLIVLVVVLMGEQGLAAWFGSDRRLTSFIRRGN